MPGGFMNLNFHVSDLSEPDAARTNLPISGPEAAAAPIYGPSAVRFDNDEAAARYYLNQEMGRDARPEMQALMAPMRPEMVPDLQFDNAQEQPLTETRVVRFGQAQNGIPVFGAQAVVELTPNRDLVAIDADLANPDSLAAVDPMPTLSAREGLARVAAFCDVPAESLHGVRPPTLMLYFDEENDAWHLAYLFEKVPAMPAELMADHIHAHGPDPSPRELYPLINYLLDAHDGGLLLIYSAQPMFDIPTLCSGLAVDGERYEFYGRQTPAGFELVDPLRNLRTLDLAWQDLDEIPPPERAVNHTGSDFGADHAAAVSAHVNAMRVYDFYKSELKRDGIDDKGMELISIVNCFKVKDNPNPPPIWRNAVWWQNRMWYGQNTDDAGNVLSMARYLDVIAHELTHGVTEHTAALVYMGQSGALNESFSDIFGVIIANWYHHGPDSDVADWDWELGAGWRPDGLPLRDLRDPTRVDMPAHMDNFLRTILFDFGGVHINSNIHNKAAYNVLTAVDEAGTRVFTPREVAILYYLTLTRLPKTARFTKLLAVMEEVAKTYYAGDSAVRERKVAAIRKAYADVGIMAQ